MRIILILLASTLSLSSLADSLEYAQLLRFDSKSFASQRSIRVSLPSSYATNTSTAYPVIYVVRGQLDTLAAVSSLDMLGKEVPEFIVVGIDGTLGEFFPSKDGAQTQYNRLLHDEVVPYIDATYRTAPYRVLVAHSMAAIFAVHDWVDDGESFAKYVAISPPLGNGKLKQALESKTSTEIRNKSPLLMSISNNEGNKAEQVFGDLQKMFAQNNAFSFKRFADQTHMSGRVNAIMHGLRQEFPDWEPSVEIKNGSLVDLKNHYGMLSKRYGFDAVIPLDLLARMSGFDSMADDAGKNANAAAVVKYVLARNAADADELFDTANQVASLGSVEGNKRLVSYICKQVPKHPTCVQR